MPTFLSSCKRAPFYLISGESRPNLPLKKIGNCSFAAMLLSTCWTSGPKCLVFLARQRSIARSWWNLKQKLLVGQLGIALQICLQLLTDSLDYKDRGRDEKPCLIPNAKHRWKLSNKMGFGRGGWLENSVSSNCNCFCMNMFISKKKTCKEGFSNPGCSFLPRLEKSRTVTLPAQQPIQITGQCNFPKIRGLRFQNFPLPLF